MLKNVHHHKIINNQWGNTEGFGHDTELCLKLRSVRSPVLWCQVGAFVGPTIGAFGPEGTKSHGFVYFSEPKSLGLGFGSFFRNPVSYKC